MSQPAPGAPQDPQIPPDPTVVELRWPDEIGANAEAVNQVLVAWDQEIPEVLYLYLGHVAPRPWLTPEVATERLAETGNHIDVTPKGAFAISRTRAEEIWTILGRHIGKLPPA
jgi:hypothetical protein